MKLKKNIYIKLFKKNKIIRKNYKMILAIKQKKYLDMNYNVIKKYIQFL